MPKKKKIAYLSGTRADYGLMAPVLRAIERSPKLSLQVYATGMHLMPEFGTTVREVKKEFPHTQRIEAIFPDDKKTNAAHFASAFFPKFVRRLEIDRPDILVVLGDRVEMFMAACAAFHLGIPVCHIHGGEETTTIDNTTRHAITKIAHIHCAATKEAARYIEKMGEERWRINTIGAPGLDVILKESLPSRAEVQKFLELEPQEDFILVTLHPVSEAVRDAKHQMEETLKATKKFGIPIVIVYPNADAGGRAMIQVIEKEREDASVRIFPNVPSRMFLALEREAVVWVGNSSAGIIESASFKTPVVNVGDRQKGRPYAKNVLNTGYSRRGIMRAIETALFDKKFQASLRGIKNPWGDGRAAMRLVKILEGAEMGARLLNKQGETRR